MTYPNFKYTGSTPGADSNTYTLFSTVTAFPMAKGLQMLGIHRILLELLNSAAGTINAYRSTDRGVNWTKVYTAAVGAIAANSDNEYDFLVEPYEDWKVEWVNGGSAQTTFSPSITGVTTRQVAT